MCRLLAMTTTDMRPELRALLFQQAMTIATSDDRQNYGWGVADPTKLYKSWRQFSLDPNGPSEIGRLDNEQAWLGHVRKPSPGTALTSKESHPFVFGRGDLIATHNGTFYESDPTHEEGLPDVDSFRALRWLYNCIREQGDFQLGFMEWLAMQDARSEWTLHCLHGGKLYIARGVRTMFLLPIGNGYIACTSGIVLTALHAFVTQFFPNVRLGKDLINIKEGGLLELTPGSRNYRQTEFSLPKPAPVEPDVGVRWSV